MLLAFVTGLIGSADASGETGFSLLPLLLILLKALGFLVGTFLLSRKIIQPAIVVIERAKSKSAPVVAQRGLLLRDGRSGRIGGTSQHRRGVSRA